MEMRECSKCKVNLPLTREFFHIRNKYPLVFRNDCKNCIAEHGKKYRAKNHEKILTKKHQYYKNNHDKILKSAKEYRERDDVREHTKEYLLDYRKTDRYKELHNERNKRYYKKPGVKKKKTKRKRERYYANIDVSRKKAREYKRRPDVKAKTMEYHHKTNSAKRRLRATVRTSIAYYLKKKGSKKQGSLLNFLGYSIDDLIKHLESLFEPWMSWDNWGPYFADKWDDKNSSTWTWQIDHIVPHSMFSYDSMKDSDFAKCWALGNLRPLSSKQNLIDGVNRIRHSQ